jgi:hypothetical protein
MAAVRFHAAAWLALLIPPMLGVLRKAHAHSSRPEAQADAIRQSMRAACGGDFRTHCRGVALGGGRHWRAWQITVEPPPPCREALAAARGR